MVQDVRLVRADLQRAKEQRFGFLPAPQLIKDCSAEKIVSPVRRLAGGFAPLGNPRIKIGRFLKLTRRTRQIGKECQRFEVARFFRHAAYTCPRAVGITRARLQPQPLDPGGARERTIGDRIIGAKRAFRESHPVERAAQQDQRRCVVGIQPLREPKVKDRQLHVGLCRNGCRRSQHGARRRLGSAWPARRPLSRADTVQRGFDSGILRNLRQVGRIKDVCIGASASAFEKTAIKLDRHPSIARPGHRCPESAVGRFCSASLLQDQGAMQCDERGGKTRRVHVVRRRKRRVMIAQLNQRPPVEDGIKQAVERSVIATFQPAPGLCPPAVMDRIRRQVKPCQSAFIRAGHSETGRIDRPVHVTGQCGSQEGPVGEKRILGRMPQRRREIVGRAGDVLRAAGEPRCQEGAIRRLGLVGGIVRLRIIARGRAGGQQDRRTGQGRKNTHIHDSHAAPRHCEPQGSFLTY